MSMGSSIAIEDDNEQYREEAAEFIALSAASLVAVGHCSRHDAIQKVTDWMRQEAEADQDETGVLAVENKFPDTKKEVPVRQITAIKNELLAAARRAADTL